MAESGWARDDLVRRRIVEVEVATTITADGRSQTIVRRLVEIS